MSIAYVGIDPGKTGAIGVISDVVAIYDVPMINGDYNFYEMWRLLSKLVFHQAAYLSLEKQQSMPKQGVSSTFSTGRGYGAWEAFCAVLTPDCEIVNPRKWKKKLGLDSDKEKSRKLAIEIYPSMADMLKRKRDHNRAEALLLAHYTKLIREGN